MNESPQESQLVLFRGPNKIAHFSHMDLENKWKINKK